MAKKPNNPFAKFEGGKADKTEDAKGEKAAAKGGLFGGKGKAPPFGKGKKK